MACIGGAHPPWASTVNLHWWLASIASWLPMSPLEIVATIFGLLSVYYYMREHMYSWPAGLLNVLLSIVLFWNEKLYADASLQVVYVVLQIYGWWQWLHGGRNRSALHISRTTHRLWTILALLAALSTAVIVLVLEKWSDSSTPLADALITSLSLVAQWMISKKKLENWWVWIIVDCISIPLLAYKHLYLYSGLYAVFLVLCMLGLRSWRRTFRSTAGA